MGPQQQLFLKKTPAVSLCCVFADFSEKKSQTIILVLFEVFSYIYTILLLVKGKKYMMNALCVILY